MGRNVLYTNEIATANRFIIEHNSDCELQSFLYQMRNKVMPHSQRWNECYDFLSEYYPEATGALVTGLTYYLED